MLTQAEWIPHNYNQNWGKFFKTLAQASHTFLMDLFKHELYTSSQLIVMFQMFTDQIFLSRAGRLRQSKLVSWLELHLLITTRANVRGINLTSHLFCEDQGQRRSLMRIVTRDLWCDGKICLFYPAHLMPTWVYGFILGSLEPKHQVWSI